MAIGGWSLEHDEAFREIDREGRRWTFHRGRFVQRDSGERVSVVVVKQHSKAGGKPFTMTWPVDTVRSVIEALELFERQPETQPV